MWTDIDDIDFYKIQCFIKDYSKSQREIRLLERYWGWSSISIEMFFGSVFALGVSIVVSILSFDIKAVLVTIPFVLIQYVFAYYPCYKEFPTIERVIRHKKEYDQVVDTHHIMQQNGTRLAEQYGLLFNINGFFYTHDKTKRLDIYNEIFLPYHD